MFDKGVLKLGRVFGIEIRLHWLFLLFFAILTGSAAISGGLLGGVWTGGFLTAVFVCVGLHELGHSLAAKAYGVPVRDITLLPFGGAARMDLRGVAPSREIVIALAGPAVNFLIVALLAPIAVVAYQAGITFPLWLLGANLVLGALNLLPAFPLDGGRVFRGILTIIHRDPIRATDQAAIVGKVIAVGLGIAGVLFDPWLLVLAFVVWFLGDRERLAARAQAGHAPWSHGDARPWGDVGGGGPGGVRIVVPRGVSGWGPRGPVESPPRDQRDLVDWLNARRRADEIERARRDGI